MAIKKERVETFITKIYCDQCEVQLNLVSVLASSPPWYTYICPNCNEDQIKREKYPIITHA